MPLTKIAMNWDIIQFEINLLWHVASLAIPKNNSPHRQCSKPSSHAWLRKGFAWVITYNHTPYVHIYIYLFICIYIIIYIIGWWYSHHLCQIQEISSLPSRTKRSFGTSRNPPGSRTKQFSSSRPCDARPLEKKRDLDEYMGLQVL